MGTTAEIEKISINTFKETIINKILRTYLDDFADGSHFDRLAFFRSSVLDRPVSADIPCFCPTWQFYALEHYAVLNIPTPETPENYYHRADGLFGPVWRSDQIVSKLFSNSLDEYSDYKEEVLNHFTEHGISEIDQYFDKWDRCMRMSLSAGCHVGMFLGYDSIMLIESQTNYWGNPKNTFEAVRLKKLLENNKGALIKEIMTIIEQFEKTQSDLRQRKLAGPPR